MTLCNIGILWNTYHKAELVQQALKKTLSDMQLEYLDLYLIHWPFAFKEGGDLMPKDENDRFILSDVDYVETWKAMEKCVELGLTKSIGVSNFNSEQIQQLLKVATVKPVTNQVECHPYLTQNKLIAFCKERDIVITAYCPLGSPNSIANAESPAPLKDPKIQELAKKYNKSPAQIVLRYLIQHGTVPIPKSSNKKRLQENIDIFNFELSEQDVAAIDSLNRNARICTLNYNIHVRSLINVLCDLMLHTEPTEIYRRSIVNYRHSTTTHSTTDAAQHTQLQTQHHNTPNYKHSTKALQQ
ncbi:hypothetical protein Cfor_07266 [Coptotermes formosanus]|uniref:NADP-dependent oxidoreductase domain-containing protein n=1 Tax=Coptotermes formosanus TaxID=36987 RepID=A0A6L2PZ59_COPFO|nr:hypothetical protein Cfor_07266 [Coptotermes formosanus]